MYMAHFVTLLLFRSCWISDFDIWLSLIEANISLGFRKLSLKWANWSWLCLKFKWKKNTAYGRQSISWRILAPIQKETPKNSGVKSWISGVQYFLDFDQRMWRFYATSIWRLYPTSMWRVYPIKYVAVISDNNVAVISEGRWSMRGLGSDHVTGVGQWEASK